MFQEKFIQNLSATQCADISDPNNETDWRPASWYRDICQSNSCVFDAFNKASTFAERPLDARKAAEMLTAPTAQILIRLSDTSTKPSAVHNNVVDPDSFDKLVNITVESLYQRYTQDLEQLARALETCDGPAFHNAILRVAAYHADALNAVAKAMFRSHGGHRHEELTKLNDQRRHSLLQAAHTAAAAALTHSEAHNSYDVPSRFEANRIRQNGYYDFISSLPLGDQGALISAMAVSNAHVEMSANPMQDRQCVIARHHRELTAKIRERQSQLNKEAARV